jgi:hypothetical protein
VHYSPVYAATVRDPTDVIGRRIAALVIDWGIAFVMIIVLTLSLGERREYATSARAEDECNQINDVANEVCFPVDTTVYVYDDGDLAALFLLPLAYHFLNDGLLTRRRFDRQGPRRPAGDPPERHAACRALRAG